MCDTFLSSSFFGIKCRRWCLYICKTCVEGWCYTSDAGFSEVLNLLKYYFHVCNKKNFFQDRTCMHRYVVMPKRLSILSMVSDICISLLSWVDLLQLIINIGHQTFGMVMTKMFWMLVHLPQRRQRVGGLWMVWHWIHSSDLQYVHVQNTPVVDNDELSAPFYAFSFHFSTRILLHVYRVHALLVPFFLLWFVCEYYPESRALTQFIGLIPAVLFLALTAMWTELPGRFSKALLLT